MTGRLSRRVFGRGASGALRVCLAAAAILPAFAEKPAGRVVAIRFWSLGDVTRVAIETDSEIRYRADRVPDPDRIFFDLHGIKPKTQRRGVQSILVGDKVLKQIRVAETQPGITRIVLDVQSGVEYSASQLTVPDRLVVELRLPGKAAAVPPVRSVTGHQAIVEPPAGAARPGPGTAETPGAATKPDAGSGKRAAQTDRRPPEPGAETPRAATKPDAKQERTVSTEAAGSGKRAAQTERRAGGTQTETARRAPEPGVAETPGTATKPDANQERTASNEAAGSGKRAAQTERRAGGTQTEIARRTSEQGVAETPGAATRPDTKQERTASTEEKPGAGSGKRAAQTERRAGGTQADNARRTAEPRGTEPPPAPVESQRERAGERRAGAPDESEKRTSDARRPNATARPPAAVKADAPKPPASGTAETSPGKPETSVVEISDAGRPRLESSARGETRPGGIGITPETRPAPVQEDPGTAAVAQRDSRGNRSLIRALGLKLGRVVLDPGHGGHDTGTIGPDGLAEKDLVLDIAKRLGALISERMGSEVVYTRTDDTFVPLETRTAFANDRKADLFLSIHANSSRVKNISGPETFYLSLRGSAAEFEVAAVENATSQMTIYELQELIQKIARKEKVQESREFAASVQTALHGLRGKAEKDRGVKKAPFVVLIGAQMPSVLAEVAFLSNPREERLLKRPEYRQRIAEALFKGVTRYANSLSHFQVARREGT